MSATVRDFTTDDAVLFAAASRFRAAGAQVTVADTNDLGGEHHRNHIVRAVARSGSGPLVRRVDRLLIGGAFWTHPGRWFWPPKTVGQVQ